MHVQERAGLREGAEVPGQLQTAIVFVDLAGFTSLADAMGDHMAAQLLERLSHIVRDAVGRWEGHVVKQIGDAFMLVALALEASRLHGGAEALADIAVGRARARASPRRRPSTSLRSRPSRISAAARSAARGTRSGSTSTAIAPRCAATTSIACAGAGTRASSGAASIR